MNTQQSVLLFTIRLMLGWIFFYAGITKVLNPDWSAAFYIADAKTFSFFYEFLLQPQILPYINFLNEWGLTLIGVSLITGAFVRYSAPLGAVMMMLYYFPVLEFPMAGDYSFLIEDHLVYAVVLIFLAAIRAGEYWGVDSFLERRTPHQTTI